MKTYLLLIMITFGAFDSVAQLVIDDSRLRSIINEKLDLYMKENKFPQEEEFFKESTAKLNLDLSLGEGTGLSYEDQVRGTLILVRAYKSRLLPNWQLSIGAAMAVAKSMILTNFHMVDPKKRGSIFLVMDFKGNCFVVNKLRKFSEENDLAVLECETDSFVPLKFSRENKTGREVKLVSHPDGSFYTYSKGFVTRHFLEAKGAAKYHKMSVSTAYAKGSSGSPVLNSEGEVVGLVSLTRSVYYNKENGIDKNLQMVERVCIPSQAILQFLKD